MLNKNYNSKIRMKRPKDFRTKEELFFLIEYNMRIIYRQIMKDPKIYGSVAPTMIAQSQSGLFISFSPYIPENVAKPA